MKADYVRIIGEMEANFRKMEDETAVCALCVAHFNLFLPSFLLGLLHGVCGEDEGEGSALPVSASPCIFALATKRAATDKATIDQLRAELSHAKAQAKAEKAVRSARVLLA